MNFATKIKALWNFLKNINLDKFSKARKVIHLSFALVALLSVALTMFMPIFTFVEDGTEYDFTAIGALSTVNFDAGTKMIQICSFVVVLVSLILDAWFLISALNSVGTEAEFSKRIKKTVFFSAAFVAAFTFFTHIFSPINILLGGESKSNVNLTALIIVSITVILYSVFLGKTRYTSADLEEKSKKFRIKCRYARIELFAYTAVSAAIAIISLLSNILTVKFESSYVTVNEISLTGIDILRNASNLEDMGRQLLSYLIFAAILIICIMLILALSALIGSSRAFGRISVVSLSISSAITLVVALFSKYYDIVQDLNEGIIVSMIEDVVSVDEVFEWKVSSPSIYYLIISVAVLAVVFLRRAYTRCVTAEDQMQRALAGMPQSSRRADAAGSDSGLGNSAAGAVNSQLGEFGGSDSGAYFDPCPAFTALDKKEYEYKILLEQRREALIKNPTLPGLVEFIVQYARDSRLHLFYTEEKIAAFIAGLGATKLTILQGMSGTGKTSLPKIVSEALMSVCDIVEVESSWRDKNELLGYYNEFSKTYTPKKFTQSLYKATLNPEVLTFIVLDEMNLSRIEYYFSDFLSIMENEPDKREIKLLNVPLYRKEGGSAMEYKGLVDGFTVKIPNNVWFIGTANRDESTYDISDKVYDRAHTMNFDKRAVSARSYNDPCDAKYLPVSALQKLFDDAKSRVDFSVDKYPIIAEVEKIIAPYNISFGNRIAVQMENFVKIYASCFAVNDAVIRDAFEIILLSKVVRKLELKTIDDKESLAEAFAKLKLLRCSEFINSLEEN